MRGGGGEQDILGEARWTGDSRQRCNAVRRLLYSRNIVWTAFIFIFYRADFGWKFVEDKLAAGVPHARARSREIEKSERRLKSHTHTATIRCTRYCTLVNCQPEYNDHTASLVCTPNENSISSIIYHEAGEKKTKIMLRPWADGFYTHSAEHRRPRFDGISQRRSLKATLF